MALREGKAGRPALPRKASRDTRRQQLIEATIRTIGRLGFARTTLTEVARTAGLSHGLINFHFRSKEQLLEDTLAFLIAEYRENWVSALERAGPEAAAQLAAFIAADFDETVSSDMKRTVWVALWGEVQARPVYQEICGPADAEFAERLCGICERLVAEGGYDLNAADAARALRVMLEGIWIEPVRSSEQYSLETARRTAFTAASAFFPRHFTPDGIRSAGQ